MKDYGFCKHTVEIAERFCRDYCEVGKSKKLCPFKHIDGEYCPDLLAQLKYFDKRADSIKGD